MAPELLILTPIFPPTPGGPAVFSDRFHKWATSKGVISKVVTYFDPNLVSSLPSEVNGINLNNARIIRLIKFMIIVRRESDKNTFIIANGVFIEAALCKLLLKRKFIAKIPGDPVWEIARRLGMTRSGIESFQPEKKNLFLRVLRSLYTYSINQSEYIISPSNQLHDLLLLWGIKKEKIKIVYNSVNTELFSPDENIRKVHDVVSVTRFVNWKGIPEIMQTCSALDLQLLLVGSGPLESELRKLARELNLKVTFINNIPNDELPRMLNSTKIFVLNSVYEATSYALLEAKSCALPVIAHASEGSAEVVNNDIDGMLCGTASYPDLITALTNLSKNDAMREHLGLNARADILNRFDSEKNFERILRVVRNTS
jgi:glycosyltransferase involved in cell wall biosynthesis